MFDLKKPRLTEKYGGGFGLVKVKDDEQEVESPYPNTLKAILECFNRLGELENAIESGELAPVVRCKDCKYYKSPVVIRDSGICAFANRDELTEPANYCSRGAKMEVEP